MNREKLDVKEQRLLKCLDRGNQALARIVIYGAYVLAVIMLFLAIYYGIGEAVGDQEKGRAINYFGGFVTFAAAGAAVKLCEAVLAAVHKKDEEFDPKTMVLPENGTVTLESALHHMAIKTGVIGWDTTFGLLLGILLMMMFCLGGNVPLILMICFVLAALLAGGHFFWSWRWKKRSFAGKMVKNTSRFIPISEPCQYAGTVEKSLKNGVLYYGKELILTEDFIIGQIETDLQFKPVAVPGTEIARLAFFSRRSVMNRYRRYDMGILDCRLHSGKSIELLIGQGPRMERVLKVLDYYHIEWIEEDMVYE